MKYFIICGLINDLEDEEVKVDNVIFTDKKNASEQLVKLKNEIVDSLKESFENETVNCVITEDSLEIYLDNGYYCNFNIYEITDLK